MTDVKTRPITQRAVSRRSEVQKSCFRFPLLPLPVRTSLCEWTVFVPLYCSSVFPRAYVLISFLAWSFSVLCSVLLVRQLATRIFSASLRGVYLLGTRGNRSFSHKFRLIASFHFEQHDEFAAGDNSHTRVLCCFVLVQFFSGKVYVSDACWVSLLFEYFGLGGRRFGEAAQSNCPHF